MDAGTSFNADLRQPLTFGTEPLIPETLSAIGTPPPSGSVVHALLVTPLNSSTSKKGDLVDAVISQPLVVSSHLFLPEGSHIRGSVLEARPSRSLGRNGQLRIVFHQLVPPNGVQQAVEASLEGVAVARGEHLSLDSEGGAEVKTPRTRYLTTAISVALASSSMADHDRDAGIHGADGGDVGKGAANGASGFRVLGTTIGAFARLAGRRVRIRLLWCGYVGLLAFPGQGARCELSQGHVDAYRTGNPRDKSCQTRSCIEGSARTSERNSIAIPFTIATSCWAT